MRNLVLALLSLAVVSCATSAEAKRRKSGKPRGHVVLNGERVEVRWSDGDSFKFFSGPYQGKGTRLQGYNTLESYGPVHRWGQWTAEELYALAKSSSKVAASREWTCTTDGKEDHYHRILVDCPDLAAEMARQGHGMAYAVEGSKASPAVLAAQAEAMQAKRGMWAKGTTNGVITSLHAVGEDGPRDTRAYNRIVDTRTGEALKREHHDRYETCQEVCIETDGTSSCMVYVPFENRYRNKAECLRKKKPVPQDDDDSDGEG